MKILAFALAIVALLLFGCVSQPAAGAQHDGGKLKVVASFYPMYEFSKSVGGEHVLVSVLVPPGVEPHNFEPTPSSIKQLSEADIFVLNGAGMEHSWAHGLIEGVGNKKLAVVETSKGIELMAAEGHHHHDEAEGEHEAEGHHDHVEGQDAHVEDGHSHWEYDPHVWLSPKLAQRQVENIRDAFIAADPEGREYYEANAATYNAKLGALDAEFRAAFSACKKKEILITHATLGYFCREYGCVQIPIEGVSHEGEPSPAGLVKIVEQARGHNVTAVYFESLISPKSAQTIAGEIGGKVLVFNSVHGLTSEEEARGAGYVSLMEENLRGVKEGLNCG